MQFIFSPLDQQIDLGFGVMGHSFRSAAEELDSNEKPTADFQRHLPICFLYRHAIELFLKSAIIIIHRKFCIPYDNQPCDSTPKILFESKWKNMYTVHSVAELFSYLQTLFSNWKSTLDSTTKTDWTMPNEIQAWVKLIEGYDRKGTFFRYPVAGDSHMDAAKSGMKESNIGDFLHDVSSKTSKPDAALLLSDSEGKLTSAFTVSDEFTFFEALRKTTSIFSEIHIGLRMELCSGC